MLFEHEIKTKGDEVPMDKIFAKRRTKIKHSVKFTRADNYGIGVDKISSTQDYVTGSVKTMA